MDRNKPARLWNGKSWHRHRAQSQKYIDKDWGGFLQGGIPEYCKVDTVPESPSAWPQHSRGTKIPGSCYCLLDFSETSSVTGSDSSHAIASTSGKEPLLPPNAIRKSTLCLLLRNRFVVAPVYCSQLTRWKSSTIKTSQRSIIELLRKIFDKIGKAKLKSEENRTMYQVHCSFFFYS